MASAPPYESTIFQDHPQPPSYEEALCDLSPQYSQGPGLPPAHIKTTQQPYPTQAVYSPPQGNNPIVSVQTIYVQPGVVFGSLPVQTQCPACAQCIVTNLEHTSGTMAWLACAGLFIFGCVYGCCLLPFCVESLKDVTHRCPNCSNIVGIYRRL